MVDAHTTPPAGDPAHFLALDAAADLVAANQQLVLNMLRTHAEAESAARDIAFRELTTELRLERQRLGQENRQILEASRLKSQFLANMSHELRTPLTAIIGFTELLQLSLDPHLPPKYHEYLGHILDSGQHLLTLIEAILDVSKVASGRLDFHPEPIDLAQTVQEVVCMLQAGAARKAVNVRVHIEPGLTPLHLDRTRLKQVLANYLSNAIKFSADGGQVTLRAGLHGNAFLRVEVEDAGIGIAQADLARLFVEFEQIESAHKPDHQGTGLGLALTRLLVEAQGGTVGVRSAPGVGSVFHFELPRQAVVSPPQLAAPAAG